MTSVNSWIKEYADKRTFQSPSATALRAMSFIMAIQSLVVGFLLLGPGDLFLQPTTPPDAWWLSPMLGGFGLWEAAFLAGSVILGLATACMRWVIHSHFLMAAVWFLFGVTWTIGGIMNSPSYLFGVGILGIFIALQHIGLIGVWRAEGI